MHGETVKWFLSYLLFHGILYVTSKEFCNMDMYYF